jgi:hypothetical protein
MWTRFFRLSLDQSNVIITDAWVFGDSARRGIGAQSLQFVNLSPPSMYVIAYESAWALMTSNSTVVLLGAVCQLLLLAIVHHALMKGSREGGPWSKDHGPPSARTLSLFLG